MTCSENRKQGYGLICVPKEAQNGITFFLKQNFVIPCGENFRASFKKLTAVIFYKKLNVNHLARRPIPVMPVENFFVTKRKSKPCLLFSVNFLARCSS